MNKYASSRPGGRKSGSGSFHRHTARFWCGRGGFRPVACQMPPDMAGGQKMKHYMVAASALLLGTSALAVAAGADNTDKPMATPVAANAVAKPIETALTLGEKAQMQLAMLGKSEKPVQPELTVGEKAQMQLVMLDKSDD